MGMEDFSNRISLERNPFSDEVLSKLEAKAKKKIEVYRPKPEDFRDLYGEEVDKDLARVQELENSWEEGNSKLTDFERERSEKNKKIANITEGIVIDQLSGKWLQNKGVCMPTSKFDDYTQGIDMVVEFPKDDVPNEYMGIGMDVTFSNDSTNLEAKLSRIIKQNIKANALSEVKYFDTEEIKGKISVPRIAIAINEEYVKQLFSLEDKNQKEKIADHNVQLIFLYQIQQQCSTFCKLAHARGAKEVSKAYLDVFNQISAIMEEKAEEYEKNPDVLMNDVASNTIYNFCHKVENQEGLNNRVA
ncbi:MAG: hypothetical protein KA007_00650 [Candidatus Pacebacteria bacterium]|nr:hypothetical protein [Candidatus Paceibacterota bacterium]